MLLDTGDLCTQKQDLGCLVVSWETSRETWLLYGKVNSDRDAFLLHLHCHCMGSWCQNTWLFSVKLAMDAAGCNQPEELGFFL